MLSLQVRIRDRLRLRLGLRFIFLHLLPFYQAYCTRVMRYCYVTGGIFISFLISRSTGISIATAFTIQHSTSFHSQFV